MTTAWNFPGRRRTARYAISICERSRNFCWRSWKLTTTAISRRCYYHRPEYPPEKSDDGYCLTFYLNGYGDDEDSAKKSWAIGLKLVQNAVMQLSAAKNKAR